MAGEPVRPLAAWSTEGRDDGSDPAVFESGIDAVHSIDRVCRDPGRRFPEAVFGGVKAHLEPACVMLLANRDLHIDHDALPRRMTARPW
jgi:hypothetical protein